MFDWFPLCGLERVYLRAQLFYYLLREASLPHLL